jgi:hypothetical protein
VDKRELLPLLQFVLRELYDRRSGEGALTWESYEALGGVEGALGDTAEKTFKNLPVEAQESLGAVLEAVVSLGDSDAQSGAEKAVRQHAALTDFDKKPLASKLIDAFEKARLFTMDKPEGGVPSVTIAHDSLLRVWPRAVEWRAHSVDFLRTRARISTRMKEGSPLLKGDPLLESARSFLAEREDGFTAAQRNWIRDAITVAETRERKARAVRHATWTGLSVLALAAAVAAVRAVLTSNHQEKLLWTASRGDHEAALSRIRRRSLPRGTRLFCSRPGTAAEEYGRTRSVGKLRFRALLPENHYAIGQRSERTDT